MEGALARRTRRSAVRARRDAMEPRPDLDALKKVYEAERVADRIVRDAEAEAAAILRRADEEAAGLLEETGRRVSLRRTEALEAAISSIDREADLLLGRAKARTEQRYRERLSGIDGVVEQLLELVLPS